ncbi:hypothetical protein [Bacillus sp. Marseille-P3661]|uniref:hypothetical protein n=1 Tax=Bacillus sp. Marseille-P3661 TaxID=1936234 RepID=UPI000C82ED70|nr:hypothetical protein [Bacillus sp. Marseille-P3661]
MRTDAFIRDKKADCTESKKMDALNYSGNYFSVDGPINISRSRQGRPLIFSSCTSPDFMNTVSKHTDCVSITITIEELSIIDLTVGGQPLCPMIVWVMTDGNPTLAFVVPNVVPPNVVTPIPTAAEFCRGNIICAGAIE